ncbi:hypothetical protein YC2023_012296 [Brassica napus]
MYFALDPNQNSTNISRLVSVWFHGSGKMFISKRENYIRNCENLSLTFVATYSTFHNQPTFPINYHSPLIDTPGKGKTS